MVEKQTATLSAGARAATTALAAVPATRLISLDAFRGLTMAGMVIVNNPGSWDHIYWPLEHAEWNGCTPTDLIFPFFLFIVGVSITLSRATLWSRARIVRRALVILGLGLFLAGFPFFRLATWRIPGVLARIAACYLIAALVFRSAGQGGAESDRRRAWILGTCTVVLLLGYWALMSWVAWPGGQPGDLTPSGNLGAFVDRAVFGESHLWKKHAWDSAHPWLPGWDPEGLVSTLPAVATTLIGAMTGLWLRTGYTGQRKAALMAVASVPLMVIGLAWDPLFPINKQLWTSSYVLFTAGAALLALAACDWAIDVRGWKRWSAPLVIMGLNAITLFVLSTLVEKLLLLIKVPYDGGTSLWGTIYRVCFVPIASPKNASLLFALAFLAAMFVVLYALYRRRIFLKV